MREPKLTDLKIDEKGTKRMRQKMRGVKKIKITIHFDADIIESLKKISKETAMPYQTLANKLLRESLEKSTDRELRLDYLEKEIANLKKKLAA